MSYSGQWRPSPDAAGRATWRLSTEADDRCALILVAPSLTEEDAMENPENAINTTQPREPWNKGKLIGQKPPLRPTHVWSIRTKLQIGAGAI